MKLQITPNKPLKGLAQVPGDKSISHRAALFAALAQGESRIENFLHSGVTTVLLEALTAMGVSWEYDHSSLLVKGQGLAGLKPPKSVVDCGNSATTMRLLIGASTAAGIEAELDGSEGLRRRPMKRVIEPLQQMGARISASAEEGAPIKIMSRDKKDSLKGIDYTSPVASAQVKTAFLLAALAADSPTILREPGPSRDHSERMLSSMGAELSIPDEENPFVQINPLSGRELNPLNLTTPGDFSSAAFLIVAALIVPGSEITLEGVGLNPTRTGLLDALIQMEADIEITYRQIQHGEPVGDITARYSPLKSTAIEGALVVRMIDEFPIFAVAASLAEGQTMVRDAGELRYKETDRIKAIYEKLSKRNVDIQEREDGFVITGPGKISGGSVSATGDHRMAMALAVAGLAAQDALTVEGVEIIQESFPNFTEELSKLGAEISHG
jgi:3-phosphoshikimate 1-carboxyvinyltransferase